MSPGRTDQEGRRVSCRAGALLIPKQHLDRGRLPEVRQRVFAHEVNLKRFHLLARGPSPGPSPAHVGRVVLQVPAVGEMETTQVRVEIRDGEDIHLMEPEYHAEQTIVYRYYGNDLLNRLRDLEFAVLALRRSYPEHRVSEQTIVVAQKASHVSLGPSEISNRAWS